MQLTDIKPAIRAHTPVTYRGQHYYITAVTLRYNGADWFYQAELHDLKANSVTIAKLEDVEIEGD